MGDIRRQRKEYRVERGPKGEVRDLPPGWTFTLPYANHNRGYDFRRFRTDGRDELAGQFRDAVWQMRHDLTGVTLYDGIYRSLSVFWRFLNDHDAPDRPVQRLDQIDKSLLHAYITWLHRNPRMWAVASQKFYFDKIKRVLINRLHRVPNEVHPDIRHRRFPRNPFPHSNREANPHAPYTTRELAGIVRGVKTDLQQMQNGDWYGPDSDVLAAHLVMIAVRTGRNTTPLLELRRDCMQRHPLDTRREFLVTHKRRGYATHLQAFKYLDQDPAGPNEAAVPSSVGELIRSLEHFTAPWVNDARVEDRGFLLLHRAAGGPQRGQVTRLSAQGLGFRLQALVRRHGLEADNGQPLQLTLTRLRSTFAMQVYRRSGGDLEVTRKLMGHACQSTLPQHYLSVTPEQERSFKFLGEAMVDWVTNDDVHNASCLAQEQTLVLEDARRLLNGSWNTSVARCKDPFNGLYAPRKDGEVCEKFLHCFKCPSMVIFEDDLHRLFSFYYALLAERPRLSGQDWAKTYGWVIRVIDEAIAPQFPADQIQAAKTRARAHPHPLWAPHVLPMNAVDA